MSEEANRTPDISKIIGVIMKNPDILERISTLMKGDGEVGGEEKVAQTMVSEPTYATPVIDDDRRRRRSQLLSAIKPYVKKSRADAIDSVIAIADIVDMMRRR